MRSPGRVIPFSFDLSLLVRRSVASLYSHLVTRPTGRALRMGIESQIGEVGSVCVSVLDFTEVVVLDYSCADEVVAKLIQRYQAADRPADAYFVARGLAEQHRHPIDEVLARHQLALVAQIDGEYTLLGSASDLERAAWDVLQQLRLGSPGEVATQLRGEGLPVSDAAVAEALGHLARRRVVLRRDAAQAFYSLSTLLPDHP
jgi:hypothetical protein